MVIKQKVRILFLVLIMINVAVACKSKDASNKKEEKTILVQLKNNSTVAALENEFQRFQLKKQKVVSRPMNIYLFDFDETKISDTMLIKEIKNSSLVKEAQQNNRVKLRNN